MKTILLLMLGWLLLGPVQASEKLGTVEFKDAEVGDAVRVLSEMSRSYNIVATEEARKRKVSLFLKQATLDSAVDGLCRVSGLWYRKNSELKAYYLMTEEEFSKEIVVARDSLARVFELKHQNVSDAAYAIKSLYGSRVQLTEPSENNSYKLDGDLGSGSGSSNNSSNRNNSRNSNNSNNSSNNGGGSQASNTSQNVEARREFLAQPGDSSQPLTVSEAQLVQARVQNEPPVYVTWNYLHNLLLVRTSDKQALTDIMALIDKLDRPAQQVLLEVKILRASLGDEERSIFDYSFSKGQTQTGTDSQGNPVYSAEKLLNLGRFPLEGGAFLAKLTGSELTATIELLRSENRLNLVSQPNILAANNKEATLRIGEDRVMVTGATTNVVTNENSTQTYINLETENKNIGTLLTIWPRINGDKTVTLDITQINSTLNEGSTSLPVSSSTGISNVLIDTITESSINLTAIARHGATIALGGMIETQQQEVHEKVPLLGDIPLLGKLFRKDYSKESRSELIILITPWISGDPQTTWVGHQQRLEQWSDNDALADQLEQPQSAHNNETGVIRQHPDSLRQQAIRLLRQGMQTCTQNSAARFSGWQPERGLLIDAIGHCQQSGLILTHARIHNTSDRNLTLQPSLFHQGWIASRGETGELAAGQSRDLYLISRQPPEQLLQQQQALFVIEQGAFNAR